MADVQCIKAEVKHLVQVRMSNHDESHPPKARALMGSYPRR